MSRWVHSDKDCPRRPWFGRRDGRRYLCRCGREWEFRVTHGSLSSWRRWVLISTPTDSPAPSP